MRRIALFQSTGTFPDPDERMHALETAASQAAEQGACIVITPEMYVSGYNIPGGVSSAAAALNPHFEHTVSAIARKARIAILAGYPELSAAGVYNSAALFDETGDLVFNHRKLHLSGPYEKSHFILDTNMPTVVTVAGLKLCPLICYDVEFPEAVRAAALAGAELIAVPTALSRQFGFLTSTLVPTRAFENGLFVAYVNHAGAENGLEYCGLSTCAGPSGIIAQADPDASELLIVEIDLSDIARARARLPYLTDRRTDLLQH